MCIIDLSTLKESVLWNQQGNYKSFGLLLHTGYEGMKWNTWPSERFLSENQGISPKSESTGRNDGFNVKKWISSMTHGFYETMFSCMFALVHPPDMRLICFIFNSLQKQIQILDGSWRIKYGATKSDRNSDSNILQMIIRCSCMKHTCNFIQHPITMASETLKMLSRSSITSVLFRMISLTIDG